MQTFALKFLYPLDYIRFWWDYKQIQRGNYTLGRLKVNQLTTKIVFNEQSARETTHVRTKP